LDLNHGASNFQREYQKQRQETIDNYRGFQTMDSSDHPVVQRGIKAAELISDVSDEVKPLIQQCKETRASFSRFGGLKSFAFVSITRFASFQFLAESNECGCKQHHGYYPRTCFS